MPLERPTDPANRFGRKTRQEFGLAPLGAVSAYRMFGGQGVYRGGVTCARIAADGLYFRTDETTRPAYAVRGPERFAPSGTASPSNRAPPEGLDDSETPPPWAGAAPAASAGRTAGPAGKRTGPGAAPDSRGMRSRPAPGAWWPGKKRSHCHLAALREDRYIGGS